MFQEKNVGIREVTFGSNVTVIQPSNLYECELGDDAFVGPFVEIQAGVVIGDRTKIPRLISHEQSYTLL